MCTHHSRNSPWFLDTKCLYYLEDVYNSLCLAAINDSCHGTEHATPSHCVTVMGNLWSPSNNTCMCHYIPAVYEYRLVPSFPLDLCYLINGVHNTFWVGTSSMWFPTCDVELDHLMSFLRLCRSKNNYSSIFYLHDREIPCSPEY